MISFVQKYMLVVVLVLISSFSGCNSGSNTDEEPIQTDRDFQIWYLDYDNDGYSNGQIQSSEEQPENYKSESDLIQTWGDCDDTDLLAHPNTIWHKDSDDDGYSDGEQVIQCERPDGFKLNVELMGSEPDCDDEDSEKHPDQVWFLDDDGDGYPEGYSIVSCERQSGYKTQTELMSDTADCDDSDVLNWNSCDACLDVDEDGFSGTNCDVNIDPDDNNPLITPYPNTEVGSIIMPDGSKDIVVTGDGHDLFVSNTDNYTITHINADDFTIERITGIFYEPDRMVLSPDNQYLYVLNEDYHLLLVIQASDGSIINSISLNGSPVNLVVSDDGESVYIIHDRYSADTVSILQTSDFTVIDEFELYEYAVAVALSPDSQFLYVTHGHNNPTTAVRLSDQTIAGHVYMYTDYTDFASEVHDRFYYVLHNKSLHILDMDDYHWIKEVETQSMVTNMTLAPMENALFVSNQNSISIIETSCNALVDTIPFDEEPGSIAIDSDGKRLYAVKGENKVAVLEYINDPFKYWYRDDDEDGFGDPDYKDLSISQPEGYVAVNSDCNDSDSSEFPGQTWYKDADGDGYSDGLRVQQCQRPEYYKTIQELQEITGDCDDNDPFNWASCHTCTDNDGDGYVGTGCDNNTDPDDADSGTIAFCDTYLKQIKTNLKTKHIVISPDGQYIYGSNDSGKLLKVRTTDDTVEKIIDLHGPSSSGETVQGIVISADGHTVYIAAKERNRVYVIQTSTDTVRDEIEIDKPNAIESTPDGKYLYAIGSNRTKLFIFDLTDYSLIKTLFLGGTSNGLSSSPDSQYVYVTKDNFLLVFRTSDHEQVTEIEVSPYPYYDLLNVEATPDGHYLYLTYDYDGTDLSIVRTSDYSVVKNFNDMNYANCVAFSPDGQFAYISHHYASYLSVFQTNIQQVIDDVSIDNRSQSYGIAVSPDGKHVYAGHYGRFGVTLLGY
jgi:DNA-binding beta-propeller fold protein YncE